MVLFFHRPPPGRGEVGGPRGVTVASLASDFVIEAQKVLFVDLKILLWYLETAVLHHERGHRRGVDRKSVFLRIIDSVKVNF